MKCPGQDSRYWKPGAIFESSCPNCGSSVEFFKDDTTRKCPNCGHRFVNPEMDFGCAAYCQFAEQCLGSLPPEVAAQQEELLKDRVAMQMRKYFQQDYKRIRHANKVARYAERIGKKEGANMGVVIIAAYLHDIGLPEAERKVAETGHGSHEQEGPITARAILQNLGAQEELIDEVCQIIARHHHPGKKEDLNFTVLYDADLLVNIEEKLEEGGMEPQQAMGFLKDFMTAQGRRLAEESLSAN